MSAVIPNSVEGDLRCGDCKELLSCGPILLIHDTSAIICGRCSPLYQKEEEEHVKKGQASDDELSSGSVSLVHDVEAVISAEEQVKKDGKASITSKSSRIPQYEALAGLHAFPCTFAKNGCKVTMEFSREEPNTHERDCPFRTLICPIIGSHSCDWIGSRRSLQDHVAAQHPGHLFNNPCSLPPPDIAKSYLKNVLVTAFNFLFLIHLKVCDSSRNIYHSVRMLGDTTFLDKFSFTLEITGNGSKYIKTGSVLRTEELVLQEPTALCTNINSLLDILSGNYDQGKFQLTINTSLNLNCLNCSKDISPDVKLCGECQRNLEKCSFNENGCLFMDVDKKKCRKHESMFCKYQTKCFKCDVNLVDSSFIEHITSSTSCRIFTKRNLNSVIRVRQTITNPTYIIFSSHNYEPFFFTYHLRNSSFQFHLYFSLGFYELKKFKCSVEITDPRTKHTETITSHFIENEWWDWKISKSLEHFSSWNTLGIDIKVNVY